MVTWVRSHKHLLAYLILAAWLLKLAAPALSQTLSAGSEAGQTRILVICTATGLKQIELPALDTSHPSAIADQDERVFHSLNAEHCLLCQLADASALVNTDSTSRVFYSLSTLQYTLPSTRLLYAERPWSIASARAPPIV